MQRLLRSQSFKTLSTKLKIKSVQVIIFTGSSNSVYKDDSPHISKIFELSIPVLGICWLPTYDIPPSAQFLPA